jgi:Flp pilus assembly protein TadD
MLEAVFEAVRSGDMPRARRAAVDALTRGVEHPVLLNLRALDFEEAGRFGEALADLRRAHILAPKDFTILNACGLCLARMNGFEEAVRCYDQALGINPGFGQAWFNRGWALERLGETVKAEHSFAKAAEIHPENFEAWARLAWLAARRGDGPEVRRLAGRALALQPRHPTAMLAMSDIAFVDPAEAEARLRGLLGGNLSTFERAMALGLLADALDARDKPALAFSAYASSNRLFRQDASDQFEGLGVESVRDALAWLNSWAEALGKVCWENEPATGAVSRGEHGHVFLVGFPRSGTTLIESILAAHPNVAALEERNTLDAAARAFLTGPADLARLAIASPQELDAMRTDYWDRVDRAGVDPAGKIFIDKNPFNTSKLPIIHRLFPSAKIIFAVRDPRDVVLSCFRRRFTLNPTTYEFLDLDRTAAVYDLTMRLAESLRERFDLQEFRLVYEDLIADTPKVTQAVCEFVGADWRSELLDIAGRGQRGEVASASSAQIARGLYTNGAGQWRRFRADLNPVLPILAHWVERFGYPAA